MNTFAARSRQRGLTLVEMLVGMVAGFFVLGATIVLVVGLGGENRRLLLEARLNQDMRAAMDIVTRDLRRAGYWQNAQAGAWHLGLVGSPVDYAGTGYPTVAPAPGAAASSQITYAYSRDNNDTTATNEQFGFRLSSGALQMNIGSGYQDLTDVGSTTVTAFTVAPRPAQVIQISCVTVCTVNCPTLEVREYQVTLTAQSASDATVQRTIISDVRVRNDRTTGACPT